MRVFDNTYLAELWELAENNSRRRVHFNLHKGFDEQVQRLFIALVKGSYVEPHYHELPHQWEMIIVLEGTVEIIFYTEQGDIIKQLTAGDRLDCRVVEIQPLDIHSIECTSDKALLLEIKEGPFRPEKAKVLVGFSGAV